MKFILAFSDFLKGHIVARFMADLGFHKFLEFLSSFSLILINSSW